MAKQSLGSDLIPFFVCFEPFVVIKIPFLYPRQCRCHRMALTKPKGPASLRRHLLPQRRVKGYASRDFAAGFTHAYKRTANRAVQCLVSIRPVGGSL